jgi:hypothetical protein
MVDCCFAQLLRFCQDSDFFAYQVVRQTQLPLRSLPWIDILLESDKSLIVSEHSTVYVMFWLFLTLFVAQHYLHYLSLTLANPDSSNQLLVRPRNFCSIQSGFSNRFTVSRWLHADYLKCMERSSFLLLVRGCHVLGF